MADLNRTIDRSINISRAVADVVQRRLRTASERYVERMRAAYGDFAQRAPIPKTPLEAWRQWAHYQIDFAQRSVLFWDTLR